MKLDLQTLADWLGGIRVLSRYELEDILPFHCRLFVDSRMMEPGGIFVCFKGENTDGHCYIEDAIQKGAQGIITEQIAKIEQAGVFQIHVASTLEALKNFADQALRFIQPKVIGITGSAGKTTTKELMQSIFQSCFQAFGTLRNYNTPIGIPLSLAQMPEKTKYFIAEMSASCPGEMEEILSFNNPDYAIITSIGSSHLEFFSGVEGVYREKIKLAQKVKNKSHVWMNGDQPWAEKAIAEGIALKRYGFSSSNDLTAINLKMNEKGITFDIETHGERWNHFFVQGQGKHLVLNALPAVAIGLSEGIPIDIIRHAIQSFSPGKGRGRCILLKDQLLILDESYNANPLSMRTSLETLLNMPFSRKILVIGDMLELGEKAWDLHFELGKMIADCEEDFARIIYVGQFGQAVMEGDMRNRSRYYCETNWEKALALLLSISLQQTSMLVKASNGIALHRLVEALEEQYS